MLELMVYSQNYRSAIVGTCILILFGYRWIMVVISVYEQVHGSGAPVIGEMVTALNLALKTETLIDVVLRRIPR